MATTLLGRKIGMTRLYVNRPGEEGEGHVASQINVPVTVIQVGPCYVTQIKTPERDGYAAVQVAFEDIKPRRSPMPQIGHDAKAGLAPKRFHREFRVEPDQLDQFELGQELTVDQFGEIRYVDVTGTSKGKGYQGTMKRHNFKGQLRTHGTERKHRSPGSIGGHASNAGEGRPKKGKRMAGQMGNERVTVRSLDVLGIDNENHLLLVKGPVPGPRQGLVMITEAKRLYKRKAKYAKAS
jgi:large subunit ribosomal protein L3